MKENTQGAMEHSREVLHLTHRRLAFAGLPLGNPLLFHLQPFGHTIQGVAALLARPDEQRRIDSDGRLVRHDEENLTGIP